MKHDTLPNLSEFVNVHPPYAVVAHKSTLELSPTVAQTSARLALNDVTQQSQNI